MAEKSKIKSQNKKGKKQTNKVSVGKLKMLVTIVPRQKAEFFEDIIQSLGANMQITALGRGTAASNVIAKKTLEFIGSEKAVIFSVLKEEFIPKTSVTHYAMVRHPKD